MYTVNCCYCCCCGYRPAAAADDNDDDNEDNEYNNNDDDDDDYDDDYDEKMKGKETENRKPFVALDDIPGLQFTYSIPAPTQGNSNLDQVYVGNNY